MAALFLFTSRAALDWATETVELSGLTPTEIKELLEAWEAPEQKEELQTLSQGNPLFIEEYLYAQAQGLIERNDPDH